MPPPTSSSTPSLTDLERQIRRRVRGGESDAELDAIVAQLLDRQARGEDSSASADGASPSSRQRLDNRFLNNVLRNTESQNRSIQRQQERQDRRSSGQRPRNSDRTQHEARSRDDRSREKSHRSDEPSGSKMDKYFSSSYDPRLDLDPTVALEGEKTGHMADERDEEAWQRVMDIAKDKEQRRHEREEKRQRKTRTRQADEQDGRRRRHREDDDRRSRHRSKSPIRRRDVDDERTNRKRRHREGSPAAARGKRPGAQEGTKNVSDSLLDAEYTRRGQVREWDKGKVVLD